MKRAAPENIKEHVAQRVIEYLEERDVELHTLKTNYRLTRIHLSRRTDECQSGATHMPYQSTGHCAQCDNFTHCRAQGCKPCICIGCDQIFCHNHLTPGRFVMEELYCDACFDELSQASSDSEEEEEEEEENS
jgi:hypothetical protein